MSEQEGQLATSIEDIEDDHSYHHHGRDGMMSAFVNNPSRVGKFGAPLRASGNVTRTIDVHFIG